MRLRASQQLQTKSSTSPSLHLWTFYHRQHKVLRTTLALMSLVKLYISAPAAFQGLCALRASKLQAPKKRHFSQSGLHPIQLSTWIKLSTCRLLTMLQYPAKNSIQAASATRPRTMQLPQSIMSLTWHLLTFLRRQEDIFLHSYFSEGLKILQQRPLARPFLLSCASRR